MPAERTDITLTYLRTVTGLVERIHEEEHDGVGEPVGAVSTFTNAYALNALVQRAVQLLAGCRVEPPVWRSGNTPGGDEAIARFRVRVRKL